LPICSSGIAVGFADQSHFARHFKRLAGVTHASSGKLQKRTKRPQERYI
jgi:AraC-like DNA-binding protein